MMVTDSVSRSHTVTTDDGSQAIYELRGLEESEIEAWSNFCASIFSYKANPPSARYFRRHYYNDPDRQASLIRVAFYENEMVASVRVFCRQVSDGKGGSIAAGGIGEVCTNSNHRRRGLSKELLQDAIEIMTIKGMRVSLLHAAPAFFPVYKSVGYACTLSEWSVVPIDRCKLDASSSDDHVTVRLASFPEDTETLMILHPQLSESCFCGCIVRSKEYWNTYLSEELKSSLWVYCQDNHIVGWLSLRPRGDRYQLREFGCNNTNKMYEIVSALLYHATKEMDANQFDLHLPTFVLENLKTSYNAKKSSVDSSFVDLDQAMSENDHGWMYKPLGEHGISTTDLTRDRPHLIWPADSF